MKLALELAQKQGSVYTLNKPTKMWVSCKSVPVG